MDHDLTSSLVHRHTTALIQGTKIGRLYHDHAACLGLACCLLPAGSEQVAKYLGIAGVGTYWAAGVAILIVAREYLIPRFVSRVTRAEGWILALVTLGCLFLALRLIYPLADSGMFGGGGDSDDALTLGAQALLAHQYPYEPSTYLGAPVTYLPGSLLLAVPFVMMGNVAYQNTFWLALFLVAMKIHLADIRQAVLLLWTTLLCARVLQLLVTGGELLASSIYVALFVLFAMRSLMAGQPGWRPWVAAVLLGVGLSSRTNYLLLAPILLSAAIQIRGWKEPAGYAAAAMTSFLAVTLPFWLHDPQTFVVACLRPQNFAALAQNSVLPHADLAVPLASTLFAVGLSFRRLKNWDTQVLSHCALVQAFPILAILVLSSVEARGLEMTYAGYGVHFLFFGAVASWTGFVRIGAPGGYPDVRQTLECRMIEPYARVSDAS